MHRKLLPLVGVVSVLFVTFSLGTGGRANADFPVNVSGEETSTGRTKGDVQVHVTFKGWFGGTGPVPDGWVAPPGEGGKWKFVIDYCCLSTVQEQGFVTILGGSFKLKLPDGDHFKGSIESGTVQFPLSLEEDLGCGPGITTVSAILLFDSGEDGDAEACLDDLRGLDPIPIWGTIRKH
jgi:hypothetical protein